MAILINVKTRAVILVLESILIIGVSITCQLLDYWVNEILRRNMIHLYSQFIEFNIQVLYSIYTHILNVGTIIVHCEICMVAANLNR